MTENDRVFDAFRNCITEPKCKDCPWTECDKLKNRRVEIPIDLALAVMRMLKAQEPRDAVIVQNGIDGSGGWWFQCPNCMMEIEPRDRYCRSCGRAVKWE